MEEMSDEQPPPGPVLTFLKTLMISCKSVLAIEGDE